MLAKAVLTNCGFRIEMSHWDYICKSMQVQMQGLENPSKQQRDEQQEWLILCPAKVQKVGAIMWLSS